ncbi:MAG: hypothetical protein MI923_09700 [Phycisphaerales bacterium]|nr:hypothetical protein [Phycisphaerales bacterium]
MQTVNPTRFLRRSLLSNAVFSTVSGLSFIAAAKPISSLIGLSHPGILIGIGVSLLVFAAGLVANAKRQAINVTEAWLAVVLDVTWVAGSVVVLLAGVLSTTGNWAVAIVADVVFLFAILQFVGLRRMRRAPVRS